MEEQREVFRQYISRKQFDTERIDGNNYLLGIGIDVSQTIVDQMGSDINMALVEKSGGVGRYEKDIETLRVISETEGMYLILTRYYMWLNEEGKEYQKDDQPKFALINKIMVDDRSRPTRHDHDIETIVNRFIDIKNCFQEKKANQNDVYYFIFFNEDIMINKGEGVYNFLDS